MGAAEVTCPARHPPLIRRPLSRPTDQHIVEHDPSSSVWVNRDTWGLAGAYAEEGPETGYPFFVRAFAGWTVTGFRRHARDVLELERDAPRGRRSIGSHRVRSGIRYRPLVARLIERLQNASWQVWIVSGTAQWAVEVGAEELGIPPQRVCGQRVELEGRRLTAIPVHPTVFGAGKVEVLRGLLDAPPDLAVGDSPNDLQLLQWARRAVVMDAGDANSLGPLARSRGWSVQPVASSWRPDLFG